MATRFSVGMHINSKAGLLFSILAGALIVVLSFLLQTRWGSVPDTSWLLTVLDRMAAGDELYRDIIETNPPFSVWLYAPPFYAARLLGIMPETAVHIYTLLICIIGASSTSWMMFEARFADRIRALLWFPLLLGLMVLLAGNAFTERDQIGAVLVLPLFVLAAWRSTPDSFSKPAARHWVVAGSCGSVLAIVKPYYAVVLLVAGFWVAVTRRDIRKLFLPEFMIPALALAVYLAVIYVSYPLFFSKTLPLLNETYIAFRQPGLVLVKLTFPAVFLVVAFAVLRCDGGLRSLANVLFAGSLAAWVPFFIQGKAWAYHQYPAILIGSVAVMAALGSLFDQKGKTRKSMLEKASAAILALMAILTAHMRFAWTEKPPAGTVNATIAMTDQPTVAILGGNIADAHPLTRMIHGRWIEPYCSDWLIIFALRMAIKSRDAGDNVRLGFYIDMASRYAQEKKKRLLAMPPDILLVSKNDDAKDFLFEEGGFGALLPKYEVVAESNSVFVYKRVGQIGKDLNELRGSGLSQSSPPGAKSG